MRHLSKVLDANVRKISSTSLIYGFMKLVYRGDNPNKETLIDIPYTSCHHCPSVYNPSCPQSGQTYSNFEIIPEVLVVRKTRLWHFVLGRIIGAMTIRN